MTPGMRKVVSFNVRLFFVRQRQSEKTGIVPSPHEVVGDHTLRHALGIGLDVAKVAGVTHLVAGPAVSASCIAPDRTHRDHRAQFRTQS